jgi:hypothetical protein
MNVRTLINKLLHFDMNAPVELVILGEQEERYSCYLPDDSIDEGHNFNNCPIIFNAKEVKDDDESIHDLILYKHCLINNLNKKKGKK